MLKQIEILSQIDGVAGDEQSVRDYIISQISPYCTYEVDALGSLICQKKGKSQRKDKLVVSAHMDEVGMIITGVTADGLLKFTTVGGIDSRVILGREVRCYRTNTVGVIGTKAIHQQTTEERSQVVKTAQMFIDIGATSKEEALKAVNLGDFVAFSGAFDSFGTNLVKAKALDDRIGCAVMIKLIQLELEYDTTFAFLVQEEVGLRGAKAAVHTINPEWAIVIESTTAADISGVVGDKQVCKLGEGAVVGFMDNSTIYDRELYKLAFATAKEQNIACQTKTMVAGGNDSGAIHVGSGGVRTIAVSVPTRYLHSAFCVADKNDIDSVARLVEKLVNKPQE